MDSLRKAVENREDAGKILHLSEKVLVSDPTAPFALHCKAVALLHANGSNQHKLATAVGCFEALRKQVESGSLSTKSIADVLGLPNVGTLVFQHAYASYRLNRFTDVVSLLTGISKGGLYTADKESFATANLLAQSYYNLEHFDEAANLYESLLEEAADEEDQGNILTNLTACYAALGDVAKCDAAVRKADEKQFEHLLNVATAAIESEDIPVANSMLDKAEQLLRRNGEANGATVTTLDALEATTADLLRASPEDKEFADDYALVLVQRAYIAHRYNADVNLAERLLRLIVDLRIGTQTTAAIAAVNLAVIKNHTLFLDTYRTLKSVQTPAVFSRFNRRQSRVVQFNTALLLLNMGKLGASKRIAERLAEEHANWGAVPLLFVAMLMGSSSVSAANAEAELQKRLGSDGSSDNTFKQLAIAQVRLRAGDVSGAVDAIQASPALLSRPAAIATLCDLQIASGKLSQAARLLSSQKRLGAGSSSTLVRVAELLIRADKPTEARDLLSASGIDTVEVKAMRVLAEASLDIKAAEALAAKLNIGSSASIVSAEVDDDEVDAVAGRLPQRGDVEASGFAAAAGRGEDTRKSGNRRRPLRHPCKNVKADAKIDYERWIPLAIRTYYKDLPERRKKEMRRLRREEQEVKRKQAEKRKAEAAASLASVASE